MSPYPKSEDRPEVSAELRAANDLVNRVRKLRWIGNEEDARALERALRRFASLSGVLTSRFDTD